VSANVIVQGFDNADALLTSFTDYQKMLQYNPQELRRRLVYQDIGHNLMPNAMLNYIAGIFAGTATGAAMAYVGVGSGSATPAVGDTALQTQIGTRVAITSASLGTTGVCNFTAWFPSGVTTWNGSWVEIGLFKESAAGGTDVMASRRAISSFTKTSSNVGVVNYNLTFTAG
jgi:hypothetical protein